MMTWEGLDPQCELETLGLLPTFLDDTDPRPARVQLDDNYQHGGGWRPFYGFTLQPDGCLAYPGDPPTRPLAQTRLRDERVILYEHSWVAVIQPDGSFEVCRMD